MLNTGWMMLLPFNPTGMPANAMNAQLKAPIAENLICRRQSSPGASMVEALFDVAVMPALLPTVVHQKARSVAPIGQR